jgi:hypothetical protein
VKHRFAALVPFVLFVSACGGGSEGGSGDATAETEDCAGIPAAELAASGGLCSDTGLRPVDGGFSFANWGGPVAEDAVTVTTAIAIFGEAAVCARTSAAGCVPFPAVQHWIDGTNLQIQGGRCEGMAVISQHIHDGGDSATQLQAAAQRTADLKKETLLVAASISRWWVSQSFEPVLAATSRTWELEPSEVVNELVDAIANKEGATIGIYANGAGHAVTPIAVTRAEDDTYSISVYDNNYPGEVMAISVDPATETWTYDVGAENSGAAASAWTGGKGSIDYVVMADREGRQNVPWSDNDRSERSKGSARITVTTGGKSLAGLIVKVGGSTIDTRDLSTVTSGVKVFPNRGGIGTGAMVEIPDGLADVKITPVVGEVLDAGTTSVELAVSVDAPGPGSQYITDTVEGGELLDDSYDDFSFDVSTDAEFENVLDVADDGDIEVGVAYEEEASEVVLEDGQDLSVVDGEGEAGLDLEVATADGEVLYEAGFDGESDTGEISVASIDIDEVTGEVTVDIAEVVPATIDEEVLAVTEADEPAQADSTEGPIAPADSDPTTDSNPTSNTDPQTGNSGGESGDDQETPSNTDAEDSPETTRATAPPDTDPSADTDSRVPSDSDAESGGDD